MKQLVTFFFPVLVLDGLKYDTNETSCETETIWGHREQTCGCQGGGAAAGRIGAWEQQQRAGVYGAQKQHGPTVDHRELYAIPVLNHNGKEYEKEVFVCSCTTESLSCTLVINIVNSLYVNFKR